MQRTTFGVGALTAATEYKSSFLSSLRTLVASASIGIAFANSVSASSLRVDASAS
jgi:hypothetical protein